MGDSPAQASEARADGDRPMRSALILAGLTIATALVIWGGLHLIITRVNPAQETPDGHFTGSCGACHFVRESAEIVE